MDLLAPAGPVYQAGTLSGNPVAMAAGLATLQKLADGKIYAGLERTSERFVSRLQELAADCELSIPRVGSIFWMTFQKTPPRSAAMIETEGIHRYNLLHGPALEAGIYLPPSGYEVCFVSSAHTEEMLLSAAEVLACLIKKQRQT